MKSYAGIGSRETPQDELLQIEQFAFAAARYMILRSGAAPGADSAFEKGCDQGKGEKMIFLPWKGFNNNNSTMYDIHPTAFKLAESIHPHFKYMKPAVKKLIARNMHQILGWNLDDPVEFVVCWTKDGCESHETYTPTKTGGTGSAIALASKLDVPIYNIKNSGRFVNACSHLISIKGTPLTC